MLMLKMLYFIKNPNAQQLFMINTNSFFLFGRDGTKQAKSIISIVLPQAEQVPKVQTKKSLNSFYQNLVLLWNKTAINNNNNNNNNGNNNNNNNNNNRWCLDKNTGVEAP